MDFFKFFNLVFALIIEISNSEIGFEQFNFDVEQNK